jgi:hypothetical protein
MGADNFWRWLSENNLALVMEPNRRGVWVRLR